MAVRQPTAFRRLPRGGAVNYAENIEIGRHVWGGQGCQDRQERVHCRQQLRGMGEYRHQAVRRAERHPGRHPGKGGEAWCELESQVHQ